LVDGEDASKVKTFTVEGISYNPEGSVNGLSEYIENNKLP
jgi:hypothetical protein